MESTIKMCSKGLTDEHRCRLCGNRLGIYTHNKLSQVARQGNKAPKREDEELIRQFQLAPNQEMCNTEDNEGLM